MDKTDYPRFSKALISVSKILEPRKDFDRDIVEFWCELMKPYRIDALVAALTEYSKTGKFAPKPADLIEILNSKDGRPNAGIAWGIALDAYDEEETAVWTEEIQKALEASRTLIDAGGEQAGRIAFRDEYNRLVAKAREDLRPIKWVVSIGHDKSRANDTINKAVNNGYLTRDSAQKYLTADVTNDGIAIAGLIKGKVADDDVIKERISNIRKKMAGKDSFEEKQRAKKEEERKARLEDIEKRKREVEEFLKRKGEG
jgi:hypothetical protein